MELSENPATPAALRQRASLTGHYLPKVRHEATHSRQTKQKTMANSDGPRGSVHDFNGFLGPSTHQKHKFCPEASDGSQPMRRPRDVNILSHTLRQCQQRIDQFPPIQGGRWLQTDLRLAMEKDEKSKSPEEISDLRHKTQSPSHSFAQSTNKKSSTTAHTAMSVQRVLSAHDSPPPSPRRAISPPFKTRLIREMLPTMNTHQGLVPKTDAYKRGYHTAGDYSSSTKRVIDDLDKARCDLILLPTNQKLSIQEVTAQTDRYKQIAGHRTFSIRFESSADNALEDEPYQRRPYLLQKSPDRRKRALSPAAFNATLEEIQFKQMHTLRRTSKNLFARPVNIIDLEPSSSVENTASDMLECVKASQSAGNSQASSSEQYSPNICLPLMNNMPCSSFPIL